jgi:hypothetical protein
MGKNVEWQTCQELYVFLLIFSSFLILFKNNADQSTFSSSRTFELLWRQKRPTLLSCVLIAWLTVLCSAKIFRLPAPWFIRMQWVSDWCPHGKINTHFVCHEAIADRVSALCPFVTYTLTATKTDKSQKLFSGGMPWWIHIGGRRHRRIMDAFPHIMSESSCVFNFKTWFVRTRSDLSSLSSTKCTYEHSMCNTQGYGGGIESCYRF